MAEVAQGQAESAEATPAPFVALGEGDAPRSREPEATEPDEPSAGGEQEASTADEGSPLDDVEYDPNDPAQKKAYEALRKQMLPKWQERVERLKGKPAEQGQPVAPEPKPAETPPQATSTDTDDPIAQVYKVDADSLRIEPTQLTEDHQLFGYEKDLDEIIDRRVDQKVQRVLDRVYQNDQQFRQKMSAEGQKTQALQAIAPYFNDIQDHPDFQEKFPEIQEFAKATEALAVSNPERWIRLVESEFDLPRNWRGDAKAEQQATGQKNLRLADKPSAAFQRPTRTLTPSQSSDGNMTLQAALDKNLRAMRAR